MHMADALVAPAVAATMYVCSGAAGAYSINHAFHIHRLRLQETVVNPDRTLLHTNSHSVGKMRIKETLSHPDTPCCHDICVCKLTVLVHVDMKTAVKPTARKWNYRAGVIIKGGSFPDLNLLIPFCSNITCLENFCVGLLSQ